MTDLGPVPVNRYRSLRCGDVGEDRVGTTVRLAGWIAAKRDHGGLLFVDLRDAGGVVQLVSHPDLPAVFERLSSLRVESVVTVTGPVIARDEKDHNPKIPTGTVEVRVEAVEVLSEADVLPFPVERDTDVPEDMRLRYRYLDLRRGPVLDRLRQRSRLAAVVRSQLSGRGFPRGTDADPHRQFPGGRTRLPRTEPALPRRVLCPPPGASAVQAAADGERSRALLPDRPVLP